MDHEVTTPASSAGSVWRIPALRGMPRHDEVCSDQTTTRADQALDERRGDPERRVRHHFEGTTRKTEIGRIGAHDRHVASIELIPQVRGTLWMQLDRDDARSDGGERGGLSLRSPHRRREQGHRERRQRLRRRGGPNDYRVDATPTVARGSRTRRTVTMKQVMGGTVTRFLRPVTCRFGTHHPTTGALRSRAAVTSTSGLPEESRASDPWRHSRCLGWSSVIGTATGNPRRLLRFAPVVRRV